MLSFSQRPSVNNSCVLSGAAVIGGCIYQIYNMADGLFLQHLSDDLQTIKRSMSSAKRLGIELNTDQIKNTN